MTLKQLLDEWRRVNPACEENFRLMQEMPKYELLVQALGEAAELIYDQDQQDKVCFGNYYANKKTGAREWLTNWGFQEEGK